MDIFPLAIILIPQTQNERLIRLILKISTQIVFLKALQETPGPPHIVNLYTVQTANILIIPAYWSFLFKKTQAREVLITKSTKLISQDLNR